MIRQPWCRAPLPWTCDNFDQYRLHKALADTSLHQPAPPQRVRTWLATDPTGTSNRPAVLLLLLLFLTMVNEASCLCQHAAAVFFVQEPPTTKNSSSSRAPKNGAQLQTTWRSAKNADKPPKTPSPPPYSAKSKPISAATGMSTDSSDELLQRHLHCRETRTTTCTKGASSTLSMSANCRTSTV